MVKDSEGNIFTGILPSWDFHVHWKIKMLDNQLNCK